MASSRLSSSEDDLTSPLEEDQEEEEEDQEEEEEEEVVVKSKVKRESVGTVEEDTQSTHLESHIDTPLNGDLASTMTLRSITLEVADTDSSIEQDGTASTEYRLWNTNGEFGLSGQFRIQGKKKTLILEDDTIQWYQKGKEIEKGITILYRVHGWVLLLVDFLLQHVKMYCTCTLYITIYIYNNYIIYISAKYTYYTLNILWKLSTMDTIKIGQLAYHWSLIKSIFTEIRVVSILQREIQ